MVGDDISAADNRLKVGGVTVSLIFADSGMTVNPDLLLCWPPVDSSPKISYLKLLPDV